MYLPPSEILCRGRLNNSSGKAGKIAGHETSGSKGISCLGREKLISRYLPRSDALLVGITHESLQGFAIGLQSVGPKIFTYEITGGLYVVDHPGQHMTKRARVVARAGTELLSFKQSLEHRNSNQWMALVDVISNDDQVHDRKDASAPEIVSFNFPVVGKQPPHLRRAVDERLWHARAEQGVDFAPLQHGRQSFSRWSGFDAHVRRKMDWYFFPPANVLLASPDPKKITGPHSVIVLKSASKPDGGGHLPLRYAYSLAFQILGLFDTGIHIHIGGGMAEYARHKGGNAHEGKIAARLPAHKAAKGHLGNVKLAMNRHAPESLFRPLHRDEIKLDAFRLDGAIAQGADAVIIAASKIDLQFCHRVLPSTVFAPSGGFSSPRAR